MAKNPPNEPKRPRGRPPKPKTAVMAIETSTFPDMGADGPIVISSMTDGPLTSGGVKVENFADFQKRKKAKEDEDFFGRKPGTRSPRKPGFTLSQGRESGLSFSKDTPPLKPPCYVGHQPYEVAPGLFIHGGSGLNPQVKADILVSFDKGRHVYSAKAYPWNVNEADFVYVIRNMEAPKDLPSFQNLVAWLAGAVSAGRSVHIGCIGGHGRTGLVLAALRHFMTGDTEAITHVRQNYCKKAVESKEQVLWLMKHFAQAEVPVHYSSVTVGKVFTPTKS